MVTVIVKRVGGETLSVSVPATGSEGPSMGSLFGAVAGALQVPRNRIRLVHRGRPLVDDDDEAPSSVADGDTVVALSTIPGAAARTTGATGTPGGARTIVGGRLGGAGPGPGSGDAGPLPPDDLRYR